MMKGEVTDLTGTVESGESDAAMPEVCRLLILVQCR